jgi:formylglycine-generating enzyme required for sulfatase activity
MHQAVHRILRFDRFALDLTRGCLRCGEEELALRPKAFDMLRYLAENAGRLVSKQEIYEAVWPDVTVSDDSIAQCVRELRDRLGDNDHSLIKTVSRRGYLLNAVVTTDIPDQVTVKRGAEPRRQRGVLQRFAMALQARRPGLSLAVTAGAGLLLVLFAISLVGRHASVTDIGHLSVAEHAPAVSQPRPSFKDCADCPEMVALSPGEFMMGSPESEFERREPEGRPRRVVIATRFAIGKFEITMDQFSAFVAESGMAVGEQCRKIVGLSGSSARWGAPEASFRQPGFEVTSKHPVVCISWHDAQAYVAWLGRRTGKPYRLPTEAEWEYSARAGTSTSYSFGDDATALCAYAKFADLASPFGWRGGCRSDIATYGAIPVGSLMPNPWGLFDMHGNAWEWVEDCWTPNAMEIPTDGSALSRPGCDMGVIRGGSWAAGSGRSRSASRWPTPIAEHYQHVGFRVALSL